MKYLFFFSFLFTFGISSSQQIDTVDFQRIKADLSFEEAGKVSGLVSVYFKILKNVDTIYLDAIAMEFSNIELKILPENLKKNVEYSVEANRIVLRSNFSKAVTYQLNFQYSAAPKKALYFIEDQIWSQGQGKYTSNWLPSIDDMNEKIEFDLSVTYDNDFAVLANGELIKREALTDNRTKWHYNMEAPMSSYLVALTIGKYSKKTEISDSGIPLFYYYYPKDSSKVESTYRYSKQMFDFMEKEIGVAYPWRTYRQVPVKDFLYSGMENTTLTIFSDALIVDSVAFNDRNYVNVNAHELAHQWFGDYVTATSGDHQWLQEGFATYYALLAERDLFGDDYYYWRLHEYAQQLLEQENAKESTSLLDPKSSSVTFYQKGCWALHVLREQIGDTVFKNAVKSYLEKYAFQNVETSDFIREVEAQSGQDLTDFVDLWLKNSALPQDDMVKSLKKSEFIQEYLDVSCQTYPSKCQDYMVSDISDQAKIKIVSQDTYEVKLEDFNNSIEVRQAIAQKTTTITSKFKKSYESLLKDASYITIETALYNLWVNFPQDRSKYLQQTNSVYGFSDYNVKLLWLALHLNTPEYQTDEKNAILNELKSYTASQYSFELRMNAFRYLKLLNEFDAVTLMNLLNGTRHHNWRFQQFAKNLLEDLETDAVYKEIIERIRN